MTHSAALRMAGELAEQFRQLPVEDAAVRIGQHLAAFWDPRIRAELVDEVARATGPVDPVVRRVAALLAHSPS